MRFAAGIEYHGGRFRGWQTQRGVRTVQQAVEQALSTVANHAVTVGCAGRTDAGVHATQQVIHFDSDADRSERSWVLGANSNLPEDVCVTWLSPVHREFHARFSAESRRYRYVILNRWVRPALLSGRVCWSAGTLDVGRMQVAAGLFPGEHDFTTFRATACQARSPVRRVYEAAVRRSGDLIYIDVHANGFLHHMVRNMAGVLMTIGHGDRPAHWVTDLLAMRDRTRGGVTAAAEGLYLVGVAYPDGFGLTVETRQPVFNEV